MIWNQHYQDWLPYSLKQCCLVRLQLHNAPMPNKSYPLILTMCLNSANLPAHHNGVQFHQDVMVNEEGWGPFGGFGSPFSPFYTKERIRIAACIYK